MEDIYGKYYERLEKTIKGSCLEDQAITELEEKILKELDEYESKWDPTTLLYKRVAHYVDYYTLGIIKKLEEEGIIKKKKNGRSYEWSGLD